MELDDYSIACPMSLIIEEIKLLVK